MPIPDFLKDSVLVFDTETALLGDHVCEIGFSLFQDCNLIREWGTFIQPPVPIDPGATAVHKIKDSDVEGYPTFEHIAWWVYNTLNIYSIHCAYNYDYDRDILEKEFARLGMKFPIKPMVDPFVLFKKYNKFHKGKKLVDAAKQYGIQFVGAHRAMNDATATGNVLFKIAAVKTDFPNTVDKFIKKQREWIEAQFVDFTNYCKKVNRDLPTPPNFKYYELPS